MSRRRQDLFGGEAVVLEHKRRGKGEAGIHLNTNQQRLKGKEKA